MSAQTKVIQQITVAEEAGLPRRHTLQDRRKAARAIFNAFHRQRNGDKDKGRGRLYSFNNGWGRKKREDGLNRLFPGSQYLGMTNITAKLASLEFEEITDVELWLMCQYRLQTRIDDAPGAIYRGKKIHQAKVA